MSRTNVRVSALHPSNGERVYHVPGDAVEIASFCKLTFDVTFPLFSKIDVNGSKSHHAVPVLKKEAKGLLGRSRSSGTLPSSWSTAPAAW